MQARYKGPVIFGIIGLALLVVVALRRRRRAPTPAPQTVPTPVTPSPAPHTPPPPALTPLQRDMQAAADFMHRALAITVVRWLLFLLLVAVVVLGLSSLRPPLSTVVLLALLAVVLEYSLMPVIRARWLHPVAEGAVGAGRVFVARACAGLALILLSVATYGYLPDTSTPTNPQSSLLLALGFVSVGLAIWLAPRPSRVPALPPPAVVTVWRGRMRRRHGLVIGLGLLALVSVGVINSRALGMVAATGASSHLQLALLLAGIALVGWGLSAARWPQHLPAVNWRGVVVVLVITGLALALRLWHLGDVVRYFVDEVNFSNAVLAFTFNHDVGILAPFSSVAAFPYTFPYIQWFGVEIFGRNLLGLRIASAVIGSLTVPGLYVLGRTLFDRPTALAGALVLATFPAHVHFSRLGLNNIADPLFGTWALAFLARGLVHNRRADYAIGGIFLGLTHYFYEGGRLLYTPLALIWLLGVALLWRAAWPAWRGPGIGLLAGAGVALPIYLSLLLAGRPVFARSSTGNTAFDSAYWQTMYTTGNFMPHINDHVVPALLLYLGQPEGSLFYRGEGLILVYAVPLFLLGLAYCLWRLRSPGPLLLVLWLLLATAGNTLLRDSAHATRYVVVYPALALLIAVGLRYGLPLIIRGARLRYALLALVTAGLVVAQADYYFNRHLPVYVESLQRREAHRDAHDALLRAAQFPDCAHIHIISEPRVDQGYMEAVNTFLNGAIGFTSLRPDEFDQAYINGLDRSVDHAFFVDPHDDAVINRLWGNFVLLPAQMSPYADVPLHEQFALLYAPRRLIGTCR